MRSQVRLDAPTLQCHRGLTQWSEALSKLPPEVNAQYAKLATTNESAHSLADQRSLCPLQQRRSPLKPVP